MSERLVLYKGDFYKSTDAFLQVQALNNKLFSVDMKLVKTKLLFWDDYQELIAMYLRLFGVPAKYFGMRERKAIERQIQRSYVRNKLYQGVTCRLSFFKEEEAFSYMIDLIDVDRDLFSQPELPIELVANDHLFKNKTYLSNLHVGSEVLWRMSSQLMKPQQLALILNSAQQVLEVPYANIFLIDADKTIYTPHVSLGVCINPARDLMMNMLRDMGHELIESKNITIEQIRLAYEIFVVNDLHSVRQIAAFESVRYYKNMGNEIRMEFNNLLVK